MPEKIFVVAVHSPFQICGAIPSSASYDACEIPSTRSDVRIFTSSDPAGALNCARHAAAASTSRRAALRSIAIGVCEREERLSEAAEDLEQVALAAHPGQIVATKTFADYISESSTLYPLGTHEVREGNHVELLQVCSGPPQPFPPLGFARRGNLSSRTTPFFGRYSEVSDLTEKLRNGEHILLFGQPGIGKTALAWRIGIELADDFQDGVWQISLGDIDNFHGLLARCSPAVGACTNDDASLAALIAKKTLLLFDDCGLAASAIEELLGRIPRESAVRLVFASREPLQLDGLLTHGVTGLACAFDDAEEQEIVDSDAVRLFMARSDIPTDSWQMQILAKAAKLCLQLRGNPASIEYAAARAKNEDDLEQLLSRAREAATADGWSDTADLEWNLLGLDSQARELLDSLSIFEGPCTIDAAAFVYDSVAGIARHVESLAGNSLLHLAGAATGDLMFAIPNLVKEVVRGRLNERQRTNQRERHLSYFANISPSTKEEIEGPNGKRALDNIQTCYRDWIAALTTAISEKNSSAEDIFLCLAEYWHRRGPLSDGLTFASKLLDQANLSARSINVAATFFSPQGRFDESRELHQTAAKLAEEAGDFGTRAVALGNLAVIERHTGDLESAAILAAESCELLRKTEDNNRLAKALNNYGSILEDLQRYDDAAKQFEESAALSVMTGNSWPHLKVLCNRAEMAMHNRTHETAASLWLEALVMSDEIGDQFTQALSSRNLAMLAAEHEHLELAAILLGASSELLRTSGMENSPRVTPRLEAFKSKLESRLGEARFASLWRTGLGLSFNEVLGITTNSLDKMSTFV